MDAACFKKLFLPYHRKLYEVAFRLLKNEDDARDVLQETYLKLWDKRDTLDAIENPEAFCVKLIHNMCIDLLRSAYYVRERQGMELTDNVPLAVPDHTDARDTVQQVKLIVAHLPAQQRQVIYLRDVVGYSYKEIGELTGLSEVNIRVLLSRARKKIREDYLKQRDYEKRRD